MIDGLVTFPLNSLARRGLGMTPPRKGDPPTTVRQTLRQFGPPFLTSVGVAMLYTATMNSSRLRGTLGQWVLGIAVTDLAARRISFRRALVREVASVSSSLTLGTGNLAIGLTPRRQALHDLVTRTQVIRRNPLG